MQSRWTDVEVGGGEEAGLEVGQVEAIGEICGHRSKRRGQARLVRTEPVDHVRDVQPLCDNGTGELSHLVNDQPGAPVAGELEQRRRATGRSRPEEADSTGHRLLLFGQPTHVGLRLSQVGERLGEGRAYLPGGETQVACLTGEIARRGDHDLVTSSLRGASERQHGVEVPQTRHGGEQDPHNALPTVRAGRCQ